MEFDKRQKQLKSFFTNDKIRYTFYFDLSTDKPPEKVQVYLEARTLTQDALLEAIDEINHRLRKDNKELIKDLKLYKPRLVGRNFKPKTDMPCLSLYQKICDLRIEQIAVQIPNKEKAFRHFQKSQPIILIPPKPIQALKIVDNVPKQPQKQNIEITKSNEILKEIQISIPTQQTKINQIAQENYNQQIKNRPKEISQKPIIIKELSKQVQINKPLYQPQSLPSNIESSIQKSLNLIISKHLNTLFEKQFESLVEKQLQSLVEKYLEPLIEKHLIELVQRQLVNLVKKQQNYVISNESSIERLLEKAIEKRLPLLVEKHLLFLIEKKYSKEMKE